MMKNVFVAFEASYGDSSYGEDLPAAGMVMLDSALLTKLACLADRVESGELANVSLILDTLNFRWIKRVGFLDSNSLAGVAGFYHPDHDVYICSQDVLDMELDGESADFQSHCDGFRGDVNASALELCMVDGRTYLGLTGRCGDHHIGTINKVWPELKEIALKELALPAADTPVSEGTHDFVLDHTAKATILAALHHYQLYEQGNPGNRSDQIHSVACGGDDSVISLDRDGIQELIGRVQAARPHPDVVDDVPEATPAVRQRG